MLTSINNFCYKITTKQRYYVKVICPDSFEKDFAKKLCEIITREHFRKNIYLRFTDDEHLFLDCDNDKDNFKCFAFKLTCDKRDYIKFAAMVVENIALS